MNLGQDIDRRFRKVCHSVGLDPQVVVNGLKNTWLSRQLQLELWKRRTSMAIKKKTSKKNTTEVEEAVDLGDVDLSGADVLDVEDDLDLGSEVNLDDLETAVTEADLNEAYGKTVRPSPQGETQILAADLLPLMDRQLQTLSKDLVSGLAAVKTEVQTGLHSFYENQTAMAKTLEEVVLLVRTMTNSFKAMEANSNALVTQLSPVGSGASPGPSGKQVLSTHPPKDPPKETGLTREQLQVLAAKVKAQSTAHRVVKFVAAINKTPTFGNGVANPLFNLGESLLRDGLAKLNLIDDKDCLVIDG